MSCRCGADVDIHGAITPTSTSAPLPAKPEYYRTFNLIDFDSTSTYVPFPLINKINKINRFNICAAS